MAPAREPVRLGLVGAGRWGKNYISTLRAMEDAVLAGLASSNPQAPDMAGSDCRVFSDWQELLAWDGIQGVILATPPQLHASMASAALARGLAVLVEKPLTMDPDEAHSLLEQAQRGPAMVVVDHIHLYNPAYIALKNHLRDKGPIRFLKSRAGNWGPFRPDVSVLWDWGSHDAALFLDLMGTMPESARARILETRTDAPTSHAQRLSLSMEFAGGVAAEAVVGNIDEEKNRWLEVGVRSGSLVYDDLADHKLTFVSESRQSEPLAYAQGSPLANVTRAFARAVAAGDHDISALEFGVRVVDLLHAMDRSLA